MRYVALLRGVNVGGKNIILKKDLIACFESAGLTNIEVYINSGNVLFDSDISDMEALSRKIEKTIEINSGISTGVSLITADALKNAVENVPDWWGTLPDSKHNAIFFISPASSGDIYAKVGKSEYEEIFISNNVIFWSAPLKKYSRTKWSKIAGTDIYKSVTIRNSNTVKKLAELANRED